MLFQVGKININKNVLECQSISVSDLVGAFGRYIRGDWGEVSDEADISNDVALTSEGKVVGVYQSRKGTEFWITTEGNRTTVRFPELVISGAGPSR